MDSFCFRAIAVGFALIAVSACSTVPRYESGRRGFFDRLAEESKKGDRDSGLLSSRIRRPADLDLPPGKWNWPLANVTVTSEFGKRGRRFHEGIDLRARLGTPVYAAQDGEVIYSGNRIKGYGNMVVVRHSKGLFSIYAHHSRNLVKKGDQVRRGQQLALSGKTGRSSGPHLHFEVRRGVLALNPRAVLPNSDLSAQYAMKEERRSREPAKAASSEPSGSPRLAQAHVDEEEIASDANPIRSVAADSDEGFDDAVQRLRKKSGVTHQKTNGTSKGKGKKPKKKR